jgi:flavoprotein hydroxylase
MKNCFDDMSADVLIVGYGPVGQALSILLAEKGWRVVVVERWDAPYSLPRATSFDGETARILAAAGVGSSLAEIGEPADAYDWRNSAGQTLLRIELSPTGPYGWPDTTTMHQPALEAVLCARATTLGNLRLLRGYTATDVIEHDDRVELVAEGGESGRKRITAAWIVGCDGANSMVRAGAGVTVTDLGFSFDWLLCDVVFHEPRKFNPTNVQICDPARPTTMVGSGPGHRRWEFMRLPGETIDELDRADTAWRLLEPFDVTPENATLRRHTVYSFQASWADEWRRGRILLAGDAAHLMPPFAGQGLCAGLRDVLNLSWKLDLVLRGASDERLLGTYTAERLAHVRESIASSVELGKIICVCDPAAVAERDAAMLAGVRAGRKNEHPQAQPLRQGLLYKSIGKLPVPPAGHVVPQGQVRRGAVSGLFDEVVGTGFVVLTTDDLSAVLGDGRRRFLDGIGAHIVRVVSTDATVVGRDDVVDADGVYLPYLASIGARCLVVRPDYHIFGAARSSREICRVVDDLEGQLLTTDH